MSDRILHRGWVKTVRELKSHKVELAIKSKHPDVPIIGLLTVHIAVEWFRPTDCVVFERAWELKDKKLGQGFENITVELVVPILERLAGDRWLVWFPNAVVEVSTNPTEITIEHDNEPLRDKWSKHKQDHLRTARPELGGRILFFPPSEVTLHSILEQPAQLGANVADIPFVYPDDDAEDIARNAERAAKRDYSISEWSRLSLEEQYQDYLSRGFTQTDAWEMVNS
jgi:hypothetical protein